MEILSVWEYDFPKGYGHTSIAYLKRCQGFNDAKNGDLNAAQFVVNQCVKKNRINELRDKFPNAILIPVIGQNKLPLALAQEINLPIWLNVTLKHTVTRKHLTAIQRLLHTPVFLGFVQKDATYILVDDIITQGGTIAALRKFVLKQGGKVVAIVALSFAIGSHAIAPFKRYVVLLLVKFGAVLMLFLETFGVANSIYELTNSQIKYLLKFSSFNNIKKKIDNINQPLTSYISTY